MNALPEISRKGETSSSVRTVSNWGKNATCHEGEVENATFCSTHPGKWVRVVRDFLKTLKYGEVHLTVHKGRIIEVRKIEKTRFDDQ